MDERALPTLPEDVIIDCILVRVPAKSVGRFRCVSKPWRSMLSSPHFARSHLKHVPEGIILDVFTSNFSFRTVNLANDGRVVSRWFHHRSVPGNRYLARFKGSCHGLVLAKEKFEGGVWGLNLFNPITLETLRVPESSECGYCSHGLGYDSLHDDYKIVSISLREPFSVSIYSVKMGIWRSLGNSPYQHRSHFQCAGLFLNGSIHWLATSSSLAEHAMLITAFSLTQEEFKEFSCPTCVLPCYKLTVIGGCLSVVSYEFSKGVFEFWVMKEYGIQDSWTKYDIAIGKYSYRFVGVLEEDEIVLIKSHRKLVAYNWRTGVWRDMVQAGKHGICGLSISETRSFTESLVSPNYGH